MFNLEPISEYRLSRPPLAQALAQVQFPLVASLATLGGLAPLQEALASDFPFVQPVQETSLVVDVSNELEVKSDLTKSWHFTDEDDRLLAFTTSSMTLSFGQQYDGVSDFLERFANILAIVKKSLSLRRCDRVSIRFLDLIPTDSVDDQGKTWQAWFNPSLLGWPESFVVADSARVDSTICQTRLLAPPDQKNGFPADMVAVIRHGIANEHSVVPGIPPIVLSSRSFMIDLDFFIAVRQAFDTARIVEQTRLMHGEIDRFFRWTLTLDGERYFGVKSGHDR